MRTSYLLLCCFQLMLRCTTLNVTNEMKIECGEEMQWHSSIVVQLIKHFHWSKLAFVTYDDQKCLQEFMVKQFSQHLVSAAVSSVGNSALDLNNSNTVIIFMQKTIYYLNSVLEIIQTKLAHRNCPKNWVLIHRNEALDLLSFFIPQDVNILLIETQPTKKMWHVYRLYSTTQIEIIKKHVGIGHENPNGLKIEIPNVPSPNLMGEKIRFVTIRFEPYFTYEKFQSKDGGPPTGLYGEIVATLQSFINFSITISPCGDNQFGKVIADKSVTGILGTLHRKESDVGVGLALSKDRVGLIDYSPSLHSMQIKILYHQIYGAKQRFFFYLEPFSSASWTCNSLLTILVAFLLSITHNRTRKATMKLAAVININWKKIQIHNKYKKWFFSFIDYVEYMAYTFFRTGVAVRVYGLSGHMIIQIFHMFSLLMFINYSSTLTSILTVTRLYVPFESLDDLVFRTSYTISTMKGTFIEQSFKNTRTGALRAGWEKMESNLMKYVVDSNQKGLELVYNEKNAYVMESASITVALKGNCSFSFVKNPVQHSDLCIGYRIGFIYKNIFNTYLQALKENGILKKINKDNLPLDHNEVCKDLNLFAALKLPKLVGLFFTLSAGIVFSLLVLIIEVDISKYQ